MSDALGKLHSRARRKLRQRIYARDGNACTVCGSSDNLTLHHVVPLALGGPAFAKSNLRTLCRSCHDEADELAFSFGLEVA